MDNPYCSCKLPLECWEKVDSIAYVENIELALVRVLQVRRGLQLQSLWLIPTAAVCKHVFGRAAVRCCLQLLHSAWRALQLPADQRLQLDTHTENADRRPLADLQADSWDGRINSNSDSVKQPHRNSTQGRLVRWVPC